MFDVGDVVVGLFALILIIFFRLLDKSNRSLDKVRKYVDRCKEDITTFIEDKASIIKDYGIALDVEKKAAAELMRRIQKLTHEELAGKVQILTQIDERIQGTDASLAELMQMAGGVQENLDRIKDESAFVDGVAKKLADVKERVEVAESEINAVINELENAGARFETENSRELKEAAQSVMEEAKGEIRNLETKLENEEKRLEQLFTEAVEKAGGRAEKVEESAIAKLRLQAEERLNKIKASFEEQLKSFQDFAKTSREEVQKDMDSMQETADRRREDWKAENAAMEKTKEAYGNEAKQFRDEWERHAGELSSQVEKQAAQIKASIAEQDEQLRDELEKHREEWKELYKDTGLDIASAAEKKIEEYRLAQEEWMRQLAGVTNDSAKLENELKIAMDEAAARVSDDFDRLSREMRGDWESSSSQFHNQLESLKEEIADAHSAIADDGAKLDANLRSSMKEATAKVGEDFSRLTAEMRDDWESSSSRFADQIQAMKDELSQVRSAFTADNEKMEDDLRSAMKESIAKVNGDFFKLGLEMRESWETSSTQFTDQLKVVRNELADVENSLADIKETVSTSLSGKMKDFEDVFASDLAKRGEETEKHLEAWKEDFNSRLDAITADSETRRRKAELKITDDMKKDFTDLSEKLMSDLAGMKEKSAAFEAKEAQEIRNAEQARKQLSDLLEKSIEDAKKTMEEVRQESAAMATAFERSGTLQQELDLYDTKLKDNTKLLSKLDEDLTKFNARLSEMKNLEDDITSRVSRFVAEKRHIEEMENDFNRLVKTSKSVEEKLAQVSSTDDILQTVQVKIRQLDDVIKEADEKFQRVERKNKILQETNDGIDRNFKALQENEQLAGRLDGVIGSLKSEVDGIKVSVEALAAENDKTLEAAEKLSMLDESIELLENRIGEMNRAREMVTRLASELRELDESARTQLKMTRSLLKQPPSGRLSSGGVSDSGAPAPRDRENVARLRSQGWSIEEIARSMGISKGEVELILELAPKDI